MPCIRFQTGCLYLAKSWRLVKLMVRWSRHVIQQCEHETRGYLTTLLRGPAAIWALRLAEPGSCAAAAGPTEACSAERWERRLGGLLEGEGGGKQGCLQCRNRAAGCGGHDDAPGGRLRAPCGRPAAAAPLSLTLRGESEWGQICHHCLMNLAEKKETRRGFSDLHLNCTASLQEERAADSRRTVRA